MSRLDFEMVRLGLSQQDRDGWLALKRIEETQEALLEALEKIATGEGYYGAQAREYKEIARAALVAVKGEPS